MQVSDEIDIFERKQVIAPQNFDGAIAAGGVSAITSIASSFCLEKQVIILLLVSFGTYCAQLISFKNYLHNFKAGKSMYWINWEIRISLIRIILIISSKIIHDYFQPLILHRDSRFFIESIFFLTSLFIFLFGSRVLIKLGVSLQKLPNDYIGFLRELGKIYCYLSAPLRLLDGVVFFYNEAFANNYTFKIIFSVLAVISTIVMTVIFVKAKRYQENSLGI